MSLLSCHTDYGVKGCAVISADGLREAELFEDPLGNGKGEITARVRQLLGVPGGPH